jgi:putative ABC transport system substrate-binding protein
MRALLAGAIAPATFLPASSSSQSRPRRIVSVTGNGELTVREPLEAFRDQFRALGYQEGRDFVWEVGYGEFSNERTSQLAAKAVAANPDLIFAQHFAVITFARQTKTIPIVVIFSGDLIEAGIVTSLAKPGGNVTGIQLMNNDLVGKRIEVLRRIVPDIRKLAIVAAPGHPGLPGERDASLATAARLGLAATFYPVTNRDEVDAALVTAHASGADSLILFPDPVTLGSRERIADFAITNKMPLASGWDNYALAGALVTYGPNLSAAWVRCAYYIDRILKGSRPADLPIEQPTVFELVVNRKTARAIGIDIPDSILQEADRVIE